MTNHPRVLTEEEEREIESLVVGLHYKIADGLRRLLASHRLLREERDRLLKPQVMCPSCDKPASVVLEADTFPYKTTLLTTEPYEHTSCETCGLFSDIVGEAAHSEAVVNHLQAENQKLRAALKKIQYKAGSHTVPADFLADPEADPGFRGIWHVARAALKEGE